MNKRVKIVATLGPAVEIRGGKKFGEDGYWAEKLDVEASAQNIAKLIEAGANTFRFNFSHGDHQEQGERMATVKRAEEIAGKKVGYLLDTKGPEIRTELFEGEAKEYSYKTGERIRVATKQGIKSTREVIALNVAGALDIFDDVEVGHQVLVDDGKLGLRVVEKDAAKREFVVEVENDGIIAKQKGVNIPNTKIPFPALAERDNDDIRFGLEQGINFIAISFVRTAKDVQEVRAICEETGNSHVQLFAKIENQQGIENLDEIIEVTDGIMIARGDMGIEVPFEMVPVYQNMINSNVNAAGKVVITAKNIAKLIEAGANAFRFNFSHGDHQEQGERMATVKLAEKLAGKKVGFLLDTKGPEIRTELFEGEAKEYSYKTGETIRVATKQGIKSTRDVIALNVAGALDIFDDVEVGHQVLVDDGKLGLRVVEKDAAKREFVVKVENDGIIAKQKGVNIPNTKIPFPALADRDNADIRFGLEQGINFIAISFVRTAKDVNEVRAICEETGNGHVQLFAKIENQQGIENLDEIIEAADGIMIARGDMGIEVPFEMVPVYQKMIITKVNAAGKVVITATNMLETMTEKPRATRSEVSDVFNAVIDGTDATMLSGESANGKYPLESVATMATIDKNAQTLLNEYGRLNSDSFERNSKTEVMASAVKDAASSMDIKLIVTLTKTGHTARLISKYRPNADILALTFDELTERGLMLNWGVIPMLTEAPSSTDDMFEIAERKAVEAGLVQSGDDIVIVAGVPLGEAVRTNTMRIRTVR